MAEYGFKGYRVIRQESIDPYRLHRGGWDALTWYYREDDPRGERRFDRLRGDRERGYFAGYRGILNTSWKKVLPAEGDGNPNSWREIQKEPFAEWFILERTEEYDETHNPKRFSFFFLNTEAVAAYQALYLENRIAPKIIVIPQYGFGMNWTEFGHREKILARTIFYPNNPLPEYIVGMSGFTEPWPEYTNRVKKYFNGYNFCVTIWRYSGDPARLNPPVLEQRGNRKKEPSENELVFVENGEFEMSEVWEGENGKERKTLYVILTYDFYIGKYTVTCQEYSRFCRETGAEEFIDRYFPNVRKPAVRVNWFEAIAYCNWLSEKEGLPPAYDELGKLLDSDGSHTTDLRRVAGYRLPTEAEWEYAARGGNKSRDYIFAGSNDVDEVAWYIENSSDRTREVGLKSPNELGLYDMSGNVWELCSDNSDRYSEGLEINPYGETDQWKVLRGGSAVDHPSTVAVSFRNLCVVTADSMIGFRIAKTVLVDGGEQ
jgi:formylglycine-generating enzyme required for sulfatase activity